MAGKQPPVKEPKNVVHQNAILCETVTKENRYQKLYTNYSINPFKEREYFPMFSTFQRSDDIAACTVFEKLNIISYHIMYVAYRLCNLLHAIH